MNKKRIHELKSLVGWAMPFLLLSAALGIRGWHQPYEKYATALLTINITVAIFAVNFSFLEYQFSPYRVLLRQIAPRHLTMAVIVLMTAFVPLVALVVDSSWLPTAALFTAPLVVSGAVLLSKIVNTEADSTLLLDRVCSDERIFRFLKELAKDTEQHLNELKRMQILKPDEAPMHEFDHRPSSPSRANDPFNFLASLGSAAIQNSDIYTFEQVVIRALSALRLACAHQHPADLEQHYGRVGSILTTHAKNVLIRLSIATQTDKSNTFANKFLEVCDSFCQREVNVNKQVTKPIWDVLSLMVETAKPLIQSRNAQSSSLIPVATTRQMACKAMDNQPNEMMYDHSVARFAELIKLLGQESIKAKDTEFLYRCLDTLGWLGCSAVKAEFYAVGKMCMHGLEQLGREARAMELECFWDRCLLQPDDHASERLEWIGTWIVAIQDKSHIERWCDTLAEAFSRLAGRICHYTLNLEAEKPVLKYHFEDKPYKFTINDNGRTKILDYSNPKSLKEMNLYGIAPSEEGEFIRITT